MTRFVCVLLPSAMTLIVLATIGAYHAGSWCARAARPAKPQPVRPKPVPSWAGKPRPWVLEEHPDYPELAERATYYPLVHDTQGETTHGR